MRWNVLAVAAVFLLTGCDDDPAGAPDADVSDADGGEPDAPALYDPPEPPRFTPCPEGWRERAADSVTTCDPWPEGGRVECPEGEAHFPGAAGCRPLGSPCPDDDWAEDLPGDAVFVRPGAPGGGDGSRDAPFATIADGLSAAGPGATVALARGSYDEEVRVTGPVTLRGACAAETVIASRRDSPAQPSLWLQGGEVELRDLQIAARRQGIRVSSGIARLEGVLIDGAATVALLAEAGVTVTGHDVVIRATSVSDWDASGHGQNGDAIGVFAGAVVDLDWVALEEIGRHGVVLSGAGATASLAHAFIGDTPRFGQGAVYAELGAQVSFEAVVIERVRGVALSSLDAGTLVRLTDVVVRDTESTDPLDDRVRTDGLDGRGLLPCTGGAVEAVRLLVEGNRDVGVLVSDARSTLVASDLVVRDTRSRFPDGTGGRGFCVQADASAVVERALFVRNREANVAAFSPETTVVLSDVEVRDSLPRECIDGGCPESGGGIGMGSYGAAHVEVRRFRVFDSTLAGLQLAVSGSSAEGGTMDLHDGEVARGPVGVNLQTEDFDVDRLMDRVIYRDNGRNLDSELLPVPDPM